MKIVSIRGSHSGHTLVAAALDCHPNVVIENRYGRPRHRAEILLSQGDPKKWGGHYRFIHPSQEAEKSDILWAGNTGPIDSPDLVVGVVRNPYVMSRSLLHKHKTPEAVIQFMIALFDGMEERVFYEVLIAAPHNHFTEVARLLQLPVTQEWLDAAAGLVRTDIPQPRMEIDLDQLFDRYDWLRRYR